VPNSHLAAYAHLYLAVVYKMERNDCVAARHLMQVFVDVPGLMCRDLLADLWDHVSLPHMLHLKVWFTKEVDLIAGWDADDQCRRMRPAGVASPLLASTSIVLCSQSVRCNVKEKKCRGQLYPNLVQGDHI
jgi:hypothetical protein